MNGATRPVFLLVDEDSEALRALRQALERRLGADYQIVAETEPERGLSLLQQLRERDEQVAVIIAAERMKRTAGELVLHNSAAGRTEEVDAGALFILAGAQPRTDWLPATLAREAGFLLTGPDLAPTGGLPDGWPLTRSPLPMETSVPGVFAAGDVRHGSTKRVAGAVGEGASAVQSAHRHFQQLAGFRRGAAMTAAGAARTQGSRACSW